MQTDRPRTGNRSPCAPPTPRAVLAFTGDRVAPANPSPAGEVVYLPAPVPPTPLETLDAGRDLLRAFYRLSPAGRKRVITYALRAGGAE